MTEMNIRPALEREAPLIMRFIREARTYQNTLGFIQWTEGYPCLGDIIQDIQRNQGYLICDRDTPIGYLCLSFDGEADYQNIEGAWKTGQPYAVLHRLAIGDGARGTGMTKAVFDWARTLCLSRQIYAIRVDTDPCNAPMRHVIEREGCQFCGTVYFQNSPKLAYELDF